MSATTPRTYGWSSESNPTCAFCGEPLLCVGREDLSDIPGWLTTCTNKACDPEAVAKTYTG